MKKQTLLLLFFGTMSIAFTLLMSPVIHVPDSLGDFLKGLGTAFIIGALLVERKMRRAS